jgi:hypothetical protein
MIDLMIEHVRQCHEIHSWTAPIVGPFMGMEQPLDDLIDLHPCSPQGNSTGTLHGTRCNQRRLNQLETVQIRV